jgi:hypothetical protein
MSEMQFSVRKGEQMGKPFAGKRDIIAVRVGENLHDLMEIAETDTDVLPLR